ncbi:MAG: hemerythrin domain-containing protein [Methylococcales bacterium]|nr:hemerythrin domain-containing protein [Methylococcales bacterium]
MRILLISSAFSGLTQRFYTELDDAGYTVSVELHLGNVEQLMEGVALFKPDLILCPFLTRRLPPTIYEHYTCLIVHPGIKGDRGASSLDWAIQTGELEWGVSLLEAREEMDAGDIWVNKTFKMRTATKSSMFYREVTQAAVDCLWEALTYFHAPDFRPQPLDYDNPDFKGTLQPSMKQADRAIDDIIYQIITTLDKVTISAVAGNAGAGGAILAIASDCIFAREGVIFNPHYKNMGDLYGSEYWTYLLPKRVGAEMATVLTEQRLPISAKKAWRIGLIDKVLDKQHAIFHAQVKHLANSYANNPDNLRQLLDQKAKTRCFDEAVKALASYRQFELILMYANFYGNDAYHEARRNFVYKTCVDKHTPDNIASHRQPHKGTNKLSLGSLYHFVWQDQYRLGDEEIDEQHKDLFELANKLVASSNKNELNANIQLLYQHVKAHFAAEEALMKDIAFHGYKGHEKEHQLMLEKLTAINHKINNNNWQQADVEDFVDKWAKHIVNSDMKLDAYVKKESVRLN